MVYAQMFIQQNVEKCFSMMNLIFTFCKKQQMCNILFFKHFQVNSLQVFIFWLLSFRGFSFIFIFLFLHCYLFAICICSLYIHLYLYLYLFVFMFVFILFIFTFVFISLFIFIFIFVLLFINKYIKWWDP